MDPTIVELAGKLGKAIAQSQEAAGLRAARQEMDKHPELKKLLEDYRAQADRIGDLEAQNKPVEVDDKRKLRDVHEKLMASEVFKRYTAAQVDYVDLIRKVSDAMRGELTQTEQD